MCVSVLLGPITPAIPFTLACLGTNAGEFVRAYRELLGTRPGTSEIMDCQVGACWVSGADPS